MKPATLLFALCFAAAEAGAAGRLADVQVIDRDSGAVLTTYRHGGDFWIAGRFGGRYAISIQSRVGERLLAVTSVDGVNVVSGESASVQQTGYVFGAYQGYQIDGWRKSDREVAAFTFTAPPDSYAARTGRAANVGVIGVALFRERPDPVEAEPPMNEPRMNERLGALRDEAAFRSLNGAAKAAAAAPSATSAAPQLGTGHGERVASAVDHTNFDRLTTQPNETIRLRYDSYEHLVAMGVIRPVPVVPARPDPFPASPGYLPDPPGVGASGLR